MANLIGNLGSFDHNSQEWDIFYGRLQQFFTLNSGIAAEKKRAFLLTHLADDTYRLARNLVHPRTLETVTYDDLVVALNGHFKPKRCTYADRANFYEAKREVGESVEDWAARIRGLAVYCSFGSSLDMQLTDRFVLGMSAGPERDRLFEQDATTLTFARGVEVAHGDLQF